MGVSIFTAAISLVLGITFLAASVPKLRQPKTFLLRVLEYDLMPRSWSRVYAALVPPAELSLGLLFLGGVAPRLGAVLALLLLASFITGMVVNLRRGRRIDCGCFGAGGGRAISWSLVGQDIVLLVGSLAIGAVSPSWLGLQQWSVFALGSAPLRNGIFALAVCATPALAAAVAQRGMPLRGPRSAVHRAAKNGKVLSKERS